MITVGKPILKPHKDQIVAMYNRGDSYASIATIFGVSDSAVRNFLLKNGVSLRGRHSWANKRWSGDARLKHAEVLRGKPSGVNGKRWKYDRKISKPSLRGENNPNWKGGITSLNFKIRDSPDYKRWRDSVFQRDNYTCQTCGSHTGNGSRVRLHAHHVKPLSLIVRDRDISNIKQAVECSEIWDINNGITLCKNCHKQTDSYGVNANYV
jgi:hypothetical protein